MQGMDARAWEAGFHAGEVFFLHCPYVEGSLQAVAWYGGWIEGAAKTLGHRYHGAPEDMQDLPLAGPVSEAGD